MMAELTRERPKMVTGFNDGCNKWAINGLLERFEYTLVSERAGAMIIIITFAWRE